MGRRRLGEEGPRRGRGERDEVVSLVGVWPFDRVAEAGKRLSGLT